MIKSALETAYKVFYNHYVRLDKSNKGADLMAIVHLCAAILLLILNILASISMIAGIKLLPLSKPAIWLFLAIYSFLAYQLITRTLKVDPPLNEFFADINASKTRLVWSIYGFLLLLLLSQGLIKKFL
ncbi:hypothetical protein LPB86_16845 [Pedobacter sp. MC2016-14]|uniref:hypothetical protein n=1 Tax=Pedobacter sp. MC2016-14 TaxID=2897327 RepID=UPI001E65C711|nr:hypothetical protein [Pedobacter sp. MC2016-14]MCD0489912.1 hypothetical protein [Pedobacter sp. MC2016-14]